MDSEAAEELDNCFLALTRPVLFRGVPLEAFGFNLMGSMLSSVLMGSMRYVVIGIPVHFIFRALVRRDHNMFRVAIGWLNTFGLQRNRRFWGGSSVSPQRVFHRYKRGDFDA
jgi:type IV secretion system protein VirB3